MLPKIKEIEKGAPQKIPSVDQAAEEDLQHLVLINKKSDKSKIPAESIVVLKILESQMKKKFNHKDYLKPLLDINYNISNKFTNDAKILLCENIIANEQISRLSIVEYHLNSLENLPSNQVSDQIRGRISIVRAQKYGLSGEYLRAAISFLQALRKKQFINEQQKKKILVDKSISYAFLEPQSPQSHKLICSLYLNEQTKFSKLKTLVIKMYLRQMISKQQLTLVKQILPKKAKQLDQEGVSALNKAVFSHNMSSLIKNFRSISFETATNLIGIKLQQLMVLIQKTYQNGQVLIDQVSSYIYFQQQHNSEELIREFLQSVDEIIN